MTKTNSNENNNNATTILSKTVIYNRTGTQYWTLEAETHVEHASNIVNCCEYHQKMHQNAQPTNDTLGMPKIIQTKSRDPELEVNEMKLASEPVHPSPVNSKTKKKRKKKKSNSTVSKELNEIPNKVNVLEGDLLWRPTSGFEERKLASLYFLQLTEAERRSLVGLSDPNNFFLTGADTSNSAKKTIDPLPYSLPPPTSQPIQSDTTHTGEKPCPCPSCTTKRSFLESELDAFYSSYYKDLKTTASSQLGDGLELEYESFPPEVVEPVDPTGLSESELNEVQKKVLRNKILFVAEDLLKNDCRKFLKMVEAMEEQRKRIRNGRQEEWLNYRRRRAMSHSHGDSCCHHSSEGYSDSEAADHPQSDTRHSQISNIDHADDEDLWDKCKNPCPHGCPVCCTTEEEEDEEENNESDNHHQNEAGSNDEYDEHCSPQEQDYCDDEECINHYRYQEHHTTAHRPRPLDDRPMLQVFVTKLFEHRVITSYREKVAAERQRKLLEELEEESQAKKEKETKKMKDREKKQLKKKEQKLQAKQQHELLVKQQEEEKAKLNEEMKKKQREAQKLKMENEAKAKEAAKLKATKPSRDLSKPDPPVVNPQKTSNPSAKPPATAPVPLNNIESIQPHTSKLRDNLSSDPKTKTNNSVPQASINIPENISSPKVKPVVSNEPVSKNQSVHLLENNTSYINRQTAPSKPLVPVPLPASVKLNQQHIVPSNTQSQISATSNNTEQLVEPFTQLMSSKPSIAPFKSKDIEYRDWANSLSQPRFPIQPATVPVIRKPVPAPEAPQPITRPTTFQSPSSAPPIEKLGSEALLDDDDEPNTNAPVVSYPFGPPHHHIHNNPIFSPPSSQTSGFGPDMAIVEQIQEIAKHAYLGLCLANGIQFNTGASSTPFFPFAQVYHRVMSLLPDPSLPSEEFFRLVSYPINGYGKLSMGFVPHHQFEFQNQPDGSLMLRYLPSTIPSSQIAPHSYYPTSNATFHTAPPTSSFYRPMSNFGPSNLRQPQSFLTSPNLTSFNSSSQQQFKQTNIPPF